MRLFDLHCDTAGECFNRKQPLLDGKLQLNICKGKSLDKWCQLFAIWIPDDLRGKAAEEYFDSVYNHFVGEISQNACDITLCRALSDKNYALASGRCAAFLTMEGASAAVGDGRIELMKSLGVKLITLTWNSENEIGFGAQTEGENGLKQRGKDFLRELAHNNIVADVSHLNHAGFYDVMRCDSAPVVASHSDCAEILRKYRADSLDKTFSVRRSLEDDQIKQLIARGALIGINLCNSFLGDPGDDGFEAVRRHMSHILDMGGENVLAFGSDFDGCDINPAMDSVDKVADLSRYLAENGFDKPLLEKIFFENADNFFKNILQ